MKPIDRRKLFTALHRECVQHDIVLVEDPGAGAGSHGSLIFTGPPGVKPVRLVLAYARDVSPGVQRSMLRYLNNQGADRHDERGRELARMVAGMLQRCLS